MAYSNESKTSTTPSLESKNSTDYSLGHGRLLQESGDGILTEDGFNILLEPETGPKDDAAVTYSRESKNTT